MSEVSDCPDVLQSVHPHNQHHTPTMESPFPTFFIFPAAATTCSRILQSLLQKFSLLTQGFLVGGASISSSLLLYITTTATRKDQCRWFTGASKVKSNIHIKDLLYFTDSYF